MLYINKYKLNYYNVVVLSCQEDNLHKEKKLFSIQYLVVYEKVLSYTLSHLGWTEHEFTGKKLIT